MTARPSRQRLSLDGEWSFWTDPDASLAPAALAARAPVPITVPAPWQSQSADLRGYTGVAWYQRSVHLGPDWLDGRCVVLGFGAVDYCAEVWLNDVKVGEHEGGYLPFELDVTHAAHPGPNTLTVRVSDPLELFAEIPHGKQSWYGPLSGLWQSVWIESRPPLHLVRARITPRGETVEVAVTLNRPLDAGHALAFEVLGPDGQRAAWAGARATDVALRVTEPLLWDVDAPYLYSLRVTLHSEEHEQQPVTAALDSVTETFGFRTIEARAGQLWLNGHPLYLRGALDQDYYPDLICTPPSLAFIEDQFRQVKAMGLNCLRTHIKIADPRYYAAADRVGLLIWTELPNWSLLSVDTQRRASETLAGMVERDWNHPAIIIWTIINESWGVDLTNPEHLAWLAATYDTLKVLDPHRLVVGNSACAGNFQVVTDIEDFHNYALMPDHYAEWRDWVANFAGRPHWTFAHAYENSAAWRAFIGDPWSSVARTPAPGVRRRGDEPLVVSEFGNWGLPDVGRLIEGYGGQEPWWFETGLEWGHGVVYPHGIAERFRTYHLNRAFNDLAALSAASQRLQVAALKYEIEQVRRHATIQGYVITELADVHWECNGLLDMRRHPKAITAALAQFNGDDLIVPLWTRLAFWTGESCAVQVLLSHFSRHDLAGSRLEWELDAWPELHGGWESLAPQHAAVSEVGTIAFQAPAVEASTVARLELRLWQADGTLASSTYQELYFFPPPAPVPELRLYAPSHDLAATLRTAGYSLVATPAAADVAVAGVLTDHLRDYVLAGGRVLWLAESDEALQTHLGGLRIAARKGESWQGDWAKTFGWLNRDRLFQDLPSGESVDFAFADLTPDHVLLGFGPQDFASNVHAGLFAGWLHHTVALIAERRAGRGRVLASTFRLSQHLATHPVAALLFRDLLAHVARGP